MTLVEIAIAISILAIGALAFAGTFVNTAQLSQDTRDTRVITVAMKNVLETLHAEHFPSLTTNYGQGTANPSFWCTDDGTVVFTDPGNASVTGSIEFFNDESSIPASFAGLNGGFDLNADGTVSSGPVSDYRILPTRITMTVVDSTSSTRVVTTDVLLFSVRSW